MSEDMDGYLLKCVIEKLEAQEKPNGLEELCACSLGLMTYNQTTNNEGDK